MRNKKLETKNEKGKTKNEKCKTKIKNILMGQKYPLCR